MQEALWTGPRPQGEAISKPPPHSIFPSYFLSSHKTFSLRKHLDRLRLFSLKLQFYVLIKSLGLIRAWGSGTNQEPEASLYLEPLEKMTHDPAMLPPWKNVTGQSTEKSFFFSSLSFLGWKSCVSTVERLWLCRPSRTGFKSLLYYSWAMWVGASYFTLSVLSLLTCEGEKLIVPA